jgi:uncharacterized membrane protein YfcA
LSPRRVSGALAHFRRGTLDIKLGLVLLIGGLGGATIGIQIFSMLRRLGQLDLIISLLYVVFLGSVGGLMLWESVNSMRRAARNNPVPLRKPGQHNWVHRSALQDALQALQDLSQHHPGHPLGFAIGILTSVMGVGGGFIMVPAMIYLLRIPTSVVIGTSLFQIIFVTAFTTVVQATTNYSVDIVLAWLLDDRRRDRRAIRCPRRPENAWRAAARGPCASGSRRRHPARLRAGVAAR